MTPGSLCTHVGGLHTDAWSEDSVKMARGSEPGGVDTYMAVIQRLHLVSALRRISLAIVLAQAPQLPSRRRGGWVFPSGTYAERREPFFATWMLMSGRNHC